MIDKDKVLPLIDLEGNDYHPSLVRSAVEAQRDADWERVKPLVVALQIIAKDDDPKDGCVYSKLAKRVLAQLKGEP